MKKQLTIVAYALVMSVFARVVIAESNRGKISFEGAVTDTTCEVVVNKQGSNATLKLPTVSSNLLKVEGDTAGRTYLSFELENCSLGGDQANGKSSASVYFVAGESVNSAGRLNNTKATDSAKNVELQILDIDQAPLDLSVQVREQGATLVALEDIKDQAGDVIASNSKAVIRHFVQYYATGKAAAGGVTSDVEYEINYQ